MNKEAPDSLDRELESLEEHADEEALELLHGLYKIISAKNYIEEMFEKEPDRTINWTLSDPESMHQSLHDGLEQEIPVVLGVKTLILSGLSTLASYLAQDLTERGHGFEAESFMKGEA